MPTRMECLKGLKGHTLIRNSKRKSLPQRNPLDPPGVVNILVPHSICIELAVSSGKRLFEAAWFVESVQRDGEAEDPGCKGLSNLVSK